jgi:hypothetical protein
MRFSQATDHSLFRVSCFEFVVSTLRGQKLPTSHEYEKVASAGCIVHQIWWKCLNFRVKLPDFGCQAGIAWGKVKKAQTTQALAEVLI